MADILVPVGPADLVDRIIVLQARVRAAADPLQCVATARRLASIQRRADAILPKEPDIEKLRAKLVTARLDVVALEVDMRGCEARADLDVGFIALTRAYLEALNILESCKRNYDSHAEAMLPTDAGVLGGSFDESYLD